MADMLHRASHSPPTPGPQYRTTTAVNSTVVISPTLREGGDAREVERQWGISYSVTKTTVKREWGKSKIMREWVGEWASRKSYSTVLYIDFMNGNSSPDLIQHIDKSVNFFSHLRFSPNHCNSTFFPPRVFIMVTFQLKVKEKVM